MWCEGLALPFGVICEPNRRGHRSLYVSDCVIDTSDAVTVTAHHQDVPVLASTAEFDRTLRLDRRRDGLYFFARLSVEFVSTWRAVCCGQLGASVQVLVDDFHESCSGVRFVAECQLIHITLTATPSFPETWVKPCNGQDFRLCETHRRKELLVDRCRRTSAQQVSSSFHGGLLDVPSPSFHRSRGALLAC